MIFISDSWFKCIVLTYLVYFVSVNAVLTTARLGRPLLFMRKQKLRKRTGPRAGLVRDRACVHPQVSRQQSQGPLGHVYDFKQKHLISHSATVP